ncbi:MAG: Ig-like domain-containing protein [Clostridia bacterium]|nr:Ig-like domain-containing protein [Clostridia bacterium]
MNKLFKRLLVLVLSLTVALTAVGTGCKKEEETDDGQPDIYIPQPPAATLTLARSALSLTIGDYFTLSATTTNTTNKVVWSSENADIATINQTTGKIEAISEGITNIVATCGDLVKKCELNVSFGGQTPEVDVLGGIKDEIILSNNDTFNFVPIVRFNNRTDYTDATFTVTSSNASVVTATNDGLLTTLENGEADVVVSASWRTKDASNTFLMSKTIKVTVQDNFSFYVNGNIAKDIELYTRASFEGSSYVNTFDFVPTVTINGGAEIPANVASSANEDIAYIEDGKIVGKSVGTTVISFGYEVGGKTYLKNFNARIIRPVAKKEGKVEYFSTYMGTYKEESDLNTNLTIDNFIWGTETEIIDAWQGENVLNVNENYITGVVANAHDFTDTTILVGSKTEIYEVSVRAAGAFVSTVEDLKDAVELRASAEMLAKRERANAKANEGKGPDDKREDVCASKAEYNDPYRKEAYVYLLNDIDASTLVVYHSASASAYHHAEELSFAATFDGNGHVISNIDTENFTVAHQGNRVGLFHHFSKDAVLKNVAITNIYTYRGSSLAFLGYGDLENVYISYRSDSYDLQGLFYQAGENINLTNVVVEYNNETPYDVNSSRYAVNGYAHGVLVASPKATINPKKEIQESLFKDTYVLSGFALGNYRGSKDLNTRPGTVLNDANGNYYQWYIAYAENINTTYFGEDMSSFNSENQQIQYDKETSSIGAFRYTGIKQYNNANQMAQAENDLTSFDSRFWNTSTGVPVWHTFKQDGVTLSVDGVTPKSAVEVVKGESVTVGLSKYGVLVPGTTITSSDNTGILTIDGASVTVAKYSAQPVTVTVANEELGVTETFVIKPLIDVNLKLGETENIVTYGEIDIDETLAFSAVYGTDNIEITSVVSGDNSLLTASGASITGVQAGQTVATVTFTYNESEYIVPITIYVKAAPSTEDNVVLYNAYDGSIVYDDLDDRVVLDAQLIVDGQDPVELTVKDNKIFGVTAPKATYGASNLVKLVVNTSYNTITFNNIEYWDKIIYEVRDLSGALDYTSKDGVVTGWYTLGNDINFRIADADEYVITDLKHEWQLVDNKNGQYTDGIYYLLDRFDDGKKADGFTPTSVNGFGGVFDGKGYSMYNYVDLFANSTHLYTMSAGLFGKLYSTEEITPVVKNFALLDMMMSCDSPIIADTVSNVGVQHIENIYVSNKGTFYSGYSYNATTHVMTQQLSVASYFISGIVRNVGHTYMSNIVLKQTEWSPANAWGVLPGYVGDGTSNLAAGSFASAYNYVFEDQTIASYDETYVSDVLLISSTLPTVAYLDDRVGQPGSLDTNGRGEKSYAAYGFDTSNDEQSSRALLPYDTSKTYEDSNGINRYKTAYDDLTGIEAGDISSLATKGIYKFKNVYHYNGLSHLIAHNRNETNETLPLLQRFATNSFYDVNTTDGEYAINWKGKSAEVTNVKVGDTIVADEIDVHVKLGKVKVNPVSGTGNSSLSLVSLESSNEFVAKVNGSYLTLVNSGCADIIVTYKAGETILTKTFTLNVLGDPLTVEDAVYYYASINHVAYAFSNDIVSAKYVTGETETEIDISYGIVLPDAAFDADYIALSTEYQEFRFTNIIKLDNDATEIDTEVLYLANGGLQYDFGDRDLVLATMSAGSGELALEIDDGKIILPEIKMPSSNEFVLTAYFTDGIVKLNNVKYFDVVITSAIEWLDYFGQTPASDGSKVSEEFIALANNINFKVDAITDDIKDYAAHVAIYHNGNGYWDDKTSTPIGDTPFHTGIYLVTKNGFSQSWAESWAGFAGHLDGRGFAVENAHGFDYNRDKDGNILGLKLTGGVFNSINLTKGHDVTIKNVAFTNVIADSASVLAQHLVCDEFETNNLNVENVYLNLLCNAAAEGDCLSVAGDNYVTYNFINGKSYSPNGLIGARGYVVYDKWQEQIKLTNFLYESLVNEQVTGTGATTITGAIFKPTAKTNVATIDANCSNVIVVSKQLIAGSFAGGDADAKKNIDTLSTASGSFVPFVRGSAPYHVKNTDAYGVISYGANETKGTYKFYQGYKQDATYDLITAGAAGAYQVWDYDNLSTLVAGDTSKVANGGMYKMVNVIRYDTKAKLAEDKTYAPSVLANFTSTVWKVDAVNGSISWASLANA